MARTACVLGFFGVARHAWFAAPLALLPHRLVPRPVLVIREVEQLARRAKWRTCDLAEALGVSVAMLNRLRAGTHVPSREVLGAILRSFGTNAHVRDLVLHFLEHELAQARAGRLDAPKDTTKDDALEALDAKTRAVVRAFVRDFLRRSLTSGAGLRVIGEDAGVLRGVAAYVRAALDDQGVASVLIAGNATVAASLRESALAAPLLIVERVDFASESVRALIAARAGGAKAGAHDGERRDALRPRRRPGIDALHSFPAL
jgi:transcriptional regulator with XRE-family HTH domain